MTRAVRREVFDRDGERCTFVDDSGRRCESRAFLEMDHVKPRARGGTDDARNLRVRCRRHNALSAERDFGREHIERRRADKKRHPRQRGSEPGMARQALIRMGFKEPQARRAMGIIEARWSGLAPPIEAIVREALLVLT